MISPEGKVTTDVIQGDRRRDRRYGLELALQFHYNDVRGRPCVGCGETIEMSRGGVRFRAEEPPPAGIRAELRIAWPFKLQGVCPLELVVRGAVRGSGERGTVVRISSYEFRTCGDRSFSEAPPDNRILRTA